MMHHETSSLAEPSVVANLVRQHGAALVRGAVTVPDDWALRFSDRLERVGRGEEDGTPFTTHYVIGAASIEMIGPEVQAWFLASPLADVAQAYFGGEVFLDPMYSRARVARPPAKALFHSHGFHQDAVGVPYVCDDPQLRPPMLTFWTPLTVAGVDAPGLEYIPIAQSERRALKEGEHWTDPTDETDTALQTAIARFGR